MPTQAEEDNRTVRSYLRRHIPYGATAWQVTPGGPWRPLSELPKVWGLSPVGTSLPADEDGEEE
jgi:hypothetical protein